MSVLFSPDATKLIVPVTVVGPHDSYEFRLTLDTGSGITVVSATFLSRLGCDLSRPIGHTRLRGVAGAARAPLIRVPAVSALNRVRAEFVVAAHDLQLGTETDGLLGLDFFRGFILKLDFIRGRITLSPRHMVAVLALNFSRLRFASCSRTIKSPASTPTFKVLACLPILPAPDRGFHDDR